MRIALVLLLIATLGHPSAAGTKGGVTMPDSIQVAGKTLRLNGMGIREATMFKVDVYVAGLYVETVSSNPAALVGAERVKRLTLHFVRDVGRKDIVKAWREGFDRNATVKPGMLKADIARLNSWMADFAAGDRLTFTYVPGAGVTVDINGTRRGTIAGEDFARSLFSIWLGAHPPNGGLKRGLLGNHGASS